MPQAAAPPPSHPASAPDDSLNPNLDGHPQHHRTLRRKDPHVAIVGAGITGTTLAIALAARGVSFSVYEQAAAPTELGAGLGFGPNAARAMRIVRRELYDAFLREGTPRDLRFPFSEVPGDKGGRGELGKNSGKGIGAGLEMGGGRRGGDGLGNGDAAGQGGSKRDSAAQRDEGPWIEFLDGTADVDARELEPAFSVAARYGPGHGAVHRARWLEVLMGMVPAGAVRFGKRLAAVEQAESGDNRKKVVLRFEDGTTAEADAVIGCDGVKSKVRELMVGGPDRHGARCGYSGKYAYRCMIPMEKAVEEIGWQRAGASSLWMGHGRHVLTFPVGGPGPGQLLNLVAFVTDPSESWPSKDARNLTLPATRDDALRDFEHGGFGKTVQKLLRLTRDKMDKWGLFDLAAQPLPSFYSGRILVIGDAAHASTPHHGSGAGFCMEDVAVLSSLLEELRVLGAKADGPIAIDPVQHLEAAFAAFDASRRERDQWLVQSSRRAADVYEWRLPGTGRGHFEAMKKDIEERQAVCWAVDLDEAIRDAKADLQRRLGLRTESFG